MRGHSSSLARRYARALLDVARAEGPAAPARTRGELGEFSRLLEASPELARTIVHPLLPAESCRRLLGALAEAAKASALFTRLLELLARHERLALLPQIAAAFGALLNAEQGVVTATAVTAVPLDETQRRALGSALCELVGKKVDLESIVDPSLLGGVVVRAAGRTYDGSVRSRLAALRRQLAAGS